MKSKFLFSFLLVGISFSLVAKEIDFCKTISFDSGVFSYPEINNASLDHDCRDNSIPLIYKGIKDSFNLSSEANPTGGASYLIWGEDSKKYSYDKSELASTIHDIISQSPENKYIKHLNPIVRIKFTPKKNGGVVLSDIIFEDEKLNSVSMVRDIYFYSKDNFAATYSSGLINFNQKDNIDFLNKVDVLFETMSIDW